MALDMNTSISMALSIAGSFTAAPRPPSRHSSLRASLSRSATVGSKMSGGSELPRPRSNCLSIYKGVSNRPLGWKPRKSVKPTVGQAALDANIKRWDGAARSTAEWDGLRRDPELWFPHGNCFVHLNGQGQSRRGPAFRIPFETLIEAGCEPLLNRFLTRDGSSPSDFSNDCKDHVTGTSSTTRYELYIPAPPSAHREQAMLYHIATRNFFAWLFKRSLVGSHLGGALVELLDKMKEFRNEETENELDILDYMDEEGYADMRNHPDHALAVLYFAEYFHFKDVWIDAFAHCTGMNEKLPSSSEFEFISRVSRALTTRARLEMDVRLERCSGSLSVWLEDELSPSYLGLSTSARSHLDRFRSFLQSYYVAKLGYYPPSQTDSRGLTFPKSTLADMSDDFEMLYKFLADETSTTSDLIPLTAQSGFCVLQNVQAFDERLHYDSLPNSLPLLPENPIQPPVRHFTKRMSWRGVQPDKLQLDSRLAALSSMAKATNRKKPELLNCSLVRAYCGFEKEVIFSAKTDKDRLSLADARKVRWILIYSVLQTLRSVTAIPDEVRDFQNVQYDLCVLTAGCPPWKEMPYESSENTQVGQIKQKWRRSHESDDTLSLTSNGTELPIVLSTLKPDIYYRPISTRTNSESSTSSLVVPPRRGTIRRALSTLGNMPELRHPRPLRSSYHEILVPGYGNGLNGPSTYIDEGSRENEDSRPHKVSEDTVSSCWSQSESDEASTRPSSLSDSRRGSDVSLSKEGIINLLEQPISSATIITNCVYNQDVELPHLQPLPLHLFSKNIPADSMMITRDVSVDYETVDGFNLGINSELEDYLKF